VKTDASAHRSFREEVDQPILVDGPGSIERADMINAVGLPSPPRPYAGAGLSDGEYVGMGDAELRKRTER
jgi:hypothetical protein